MALSSGSVPSAIAVVRLSGPDCHNIYSSFVDKVCVPRQLTYCTVRNPTNGDIIDHCLGVFFPCSQSFTGEDSFEFQLHGSPAVVSCLLNALLSLKNVRFAEPGEFIRRAYANGRLDLAQVEGVADLLAAETENQRKLAVIRMEGGVAKHLSGIRRQLISMLSLIEAEIDFSSEGDVGSIDSVLMVNTLVSLKNNLAATIGRANSGRLLRDGVRIGFGGLPNVGKSSLLNALVQSNVAIVSSEAGTTRDLKEVDIQIKGQLFRLIDSAGIRDSESIAEQEGVRRAQDMLKGCDLVFWVCAPDVPGSDVVPSFESRTISVLNKCDLDGNMVGECRVSALKGQIAPVRRILEDYADQVTARSESVVFSRQRDIEALRTAFDSLDEIGLVGLEGLVQHAPELVAEHFRRALYALDRLIGKVGAEDILDSVFSSFCVGK